MNFLANKMLLLVVICVFLPQMASARPGSDEVSICYLFNQEKLIQRDVCITNFSTGAGGYAYSFTIKEKEYTLESAQCEDEKGEWINDCELSLEGKDALMYRRSVFLATKSTQDVHEEDDLFCYRTKDGSLDICTK